MASNKGENVSNITIGAATSKDDEYVVIENEFDQIRKALGMYIASEETDAAMHLLKEITNNAIDELANPQSDGNEVIIKFDEEMGQFLVQDNGRGIPFDRMVSSCTQKHSSTKIVRDQPWVKGLAGRNGVGMVVVTALSDYMSIVSHRDNHEQKLEFIDGEMKGPTIKKISDSETGTAISFIPSEKHLGKINLTSDLVEDYLRCMSYTLLPNMKIKYYTEVKGDNGKTAKRAITYKPVGIAAAVEYMSSSLEFSPISVEMTTLDFDLEIAFSYDRTMNIPTIDSYCNYVHTVDGGHHETSAIQALCTYFCREARKLEPNSKYEVTFDDCRNGLILAVNCRHMDPKYEGQHKTKIDNKDVLSVGKGLLVEELSKYFERNNAQLRKIIAFLRTNAKARMEVNKIKDVPTKKASTFIDDLEIPGFHNTTNRNSDNYAEIYICEGDSAGDQMNAIRNRKHQAILALRGPIDNVTGMSLSTMMQKDICQRIVKVFNAGVGPSFDIRKLRWNKIIIMTDADIDGTNLASLVINFIYRFMPEIIRSGRLYVGRPPLYRLDKNSYPKYKGNEWVYDIKEYYTIINNLASDLIDVTLHYDDDDSDEKECVTMPKNGLVNWLNSNKEYLTELAALNTNVSTKPTLIEHVCWAKLKFNNDSVKIKEYIESIYPEMNYNIDDDTIDGSINGNHYTMVADRIFDKNARRFMEVLKYNPCLIVGVKNKNVENDTISPMTIGELLNLISTKVTIKVEKRYKGLGEAAGMIMFVTTLHPKLRKLYRLIIGSEQDAVEALNLLHEKTEKMRANRRELLKNTTISYNDIDN